MIFSVQDIFPSLVSILGAFIAFSLSLTVKRAVEILLHRFRTRDSKRLERSILEAAETGGFEGVPPLPTNKEIRDMLVALGARFGGNILSTARRLYVEYGFAERDIRALSSLRFERQMLALYRLRTLDLPIPETLWPRLSRSKNLDFRWAFMEYLIQHKGKAAIPWLMGFISQPSNQKRGIILHLLCCAAKISPETTSMLLEYSHNDLLREQALRALAVYPLPGIERLIIQSIRMSSSEEILVAGIKALISHPHSDWLPYLETFADHPNWVLRMLIARSLENHPGYRSWVILDHLSEDLSYHVRFSAIQSLIRQKPASDPTLKKIESNPNHPAFFIYQQLVGREIAAAKKGRVA